MVIRTLKSYLLMTFIIYIVISLKEKAVDGNTVSILSAFKVEFSAFLCKWQHTGSQGTKCVRHTKYVYRQGGEEDIENNKRALE